MISADYVIKMSCTLWVAAPHGKTISNKHLYYVYPSPFPPVNTCLLNTIKISANNVIITGYLNAKHTDFYCSKTDK